MSCFDVKICCMVLQAFYVPFAFLGISLISGNDWVSDVLGILAGHL